MRLLLLIIIQLCFANAGFSQDSPKKFEYRLASIANRFRTTLADEDDCSRVKREASDLIEDLEKALKSDDYSMIETQTLKELKQESEAMEDFIGAVGDCEYHYIAYADLILANRRVSAQVSYVFQEKYCVDLLKVSLGDFSSYLLLNNSDKNYRVSYKWSTSNGMSSGNGVIAVTKFALSTLYSSRDENINRKFSSIHCEEF